jgi:hypothetical protein
MSRLPGWNAPTIPELLREEDCPGPVLVEAAALIERLMASNTELLTACKSTLVAIASLQDDKDGSLISPTRTVLRNTIARVEGREP